MDNVETIALNAIQGLGSSQPAGGQFYLVFDKNGNCPNFFNYTGTLLDFNREMLKVTTGAQTHADAVEVLRKTMVGALRHGKTLIINVENLRPSFRVDYKADCLPEWVWDYQTLMNDCNKLVKEDENTDHMGGTPFHKNEGFALIVLAKYSDDEDVASF